VNPPIECSGVGVDTVDIVLELELQVQRRRGEHDRGVDSLFIHQRQAQVPTEIVLFLLAELGE
jgi:hypothetical protein